MTLAESLGYLAVKTAGLPAIGQQIGQASFRGGPHPGAPSVPDQVGSALRGVDRMAAKVTGTTWPQMMQRHTSRLSMVTPAIGRKFVQPPL